MTTGKDMLEEAKITGITPAVFTFNGMLEDCPPTDVYKRQASRFYTEIIEGIFDSN